jgi:ribosome maturation factor RimP
LHPLLTRIFKKEGTESPLFCYVTEMEIANKLKDIAESKLSSDQFIVDVLYSGKKSPARLLIIVDGDKGVTIDQCADLSRELSQHLDEANLMPVAYTLEVSTPGLDQPLKLKRQFFKNVGRQFKVHLNDKMIVQGKLVGVTEENLTLEQQKGEGKKKEMVIIELPFVNIERAFVTVSFK